MIGMGNVFLCFMYICIFKSGMIKKRNWKITIEQCIDTVIDLEHFIWVFDWTWLQLFTHDHGLYFIGLGSKYVSSR